jgi:hypothetical protein
MGALAFIGVQAVAGCGEVTCPEPLSNVNGACLKVEPVVEAELCDGVDNDGDTEVDEDWDELGQSCGEGAGVGECVEGAFVCTDDGLGVVCLNAVGPSDEVCDGNDNDCDGTLDNGPDEICDGEDNDCDGLIDEGVLSVKSEVFDDHASVAAVDDGFVVTQIVGDALLVRTYDKSGDPSGAFDLIESPTTEMTFLVSDSAGARVLVALGESWFHVVDVHVDSDLVPIILETREPHEVWRQGPYFGAYLPPYHPRVLASPPRFLGYRDLMTFALTPFGTGDLLGLAVEPTVAVDIPTASVFDAAGSYVVWEQSDNLRVGRLLDDGDLESDIDVARGNAPGIAMRSGGPGVVYIQDGKLGLSELNGFTLQCSNGGFCNDEVYAEDLQEELVGPTGLAYDDANDSWFVVAGTQLIVVGRGENGAVVKQAETLDALDDAPVRVDVAVTGGAAAIVHAASDGESALTFLGCF